MTTGETLITLLLIIIVYLLYHIAKQLSYLTGKRIKISFLNWQVNKPFQIPKLPVKPTKKTPPEKLVN
jgi:hypothetical protein